jgi:hypothetical protein
MQTPRIIAQIPGDDIAARVIAGTVDGMIAEGFPGTEGRTREELLDIVHRVHYETRELVYSGRMRAADAAAYEFRRYTEELTKPAEPPREDGGDR